MYVRKFECTSACRLPRKTASLWERGSEAQPSPHPQSRLFPPQVHSRLVPRYVSAVTYALAMLWVPAWAPSPFSSSTLQLPYVKLGHARTRSRPTCRSSSFLHVVMPAERHPLEHDPVDSGISAPGNAAASPRLASKMVGKSGLEAVESVVGGGAEGDAGASSTAATVAKVAAACPELLLLERRKLLRMAKELRDMVRRRHHMIFTHCAKKTATNLQCKSAARKKLKAREYTHKLVDFTAVDEGKGPPNPLA